jgi:hypothetical protein
MSNIVMPTKHLPDPEDPGPMGNWHTRIFVCHRESDARRFVSLVCHGPVEQRGEVYGVLMTPYRNAWGQIMAGWEYAVVYQAPAEIGMEVKT